MLGTRTSLDLDLKILSTLFRFLFRFLPSISEPFPLLLYVLPDDFRRLRRLLAMIVI